jgi:cytochrome c-type biogenesis protein CcmH/NrfG
MSEITDLINQAEKLKDDDKPAEAIQTLEQVLEKDGDNVLAHLMLSRICTQTGDHDRSIQHGEKACELEPNEGFNYTALSVAYQRAFAGTGENKYIQMAEDAMAKSHSLQ